MIVWDVMHILRELSPENFACEWDNVGLMVGKETQKVKKILVTLDVTEDAIEQAKLVGANMIVSHHPLIFKAIKNVNDSTAQGRKILSLAESQIACYAMHTNFDCKGSMAKVIYDRLNLDNSREIDGDVLEVTKTIKVEGENLFGESFEGLEDYGIGLIGGINEWDSISDNPILSMTASEFAKKVKYEFKLPYVTIYGDPQTVISRVAVCPGSGRSEINVAIEKKIDLLLTGDIGHHEALDAVENGLIVVDATHYGLEKEFVDFIVDYLSKHCENCEVEGYLPGFAGTMM